MITKIIGAAPVVILTAALFSCAGGFSQKAGVRQKTSAVPHIIKKNGTYPAYEGQDGFNTLIQNRVAELYRTFEAEVDSNIEAARQAGDPRFADGKVFDFNISYETGRRDQQYISVVMDYQWYSGGAHGAELVESYLWDVRAKKLVSFNDALKLAGFPSLLTLSVNVRNKLEDQLNPGKNAELSRMIKSGTEPEADNFKVFLLENTRITFYFQRYQAAAGASGVQKVSFPVSGNP
jgi:nitrogen regulatory protein PII